MNKRNFPSHGEINLDTDGQILIVNASGPANLEMVLAYQRSVIAYRQKIMHQRWVSLVLLSGTPLFSPEARSILAETIKQAKSMRLYATAVVFVEMEYVDAIKRFWQEIYEDTGVTFAFFETETQAREWLNNQLNE